MYMCNFSSEVHWVQNRAENMASGGLLFKNIDGMSDPGRHALYSRLNYAICGISLGWYTSFDRHWNTTAGTSMKNWNHAASGGKMSWWKV